MPLEKRDLCPRCKGEARSGDKFCRACGAVLLLQCPDCGKPVKPTDKYCAACGKRRWYFLELCKFLLKLNAIYQEFHFFNFFFFSTEHQYR